MPTKLPDSWGDRDPLKDLDLSGSGPSTLDLIRGKPTPQHDRQWEKRNRAYSYIIPEPLQAAAIQVREDVLSIAQYDSQGNPRTDSTTADDIAQQLMDWALAQVAQNPGLLPLRPNAHSRKGQMTVSWEAWDGWDKTRLQLRPAAKRKGKKEKKIFLAFRWGSEIDQRIKSLAGSSPETSAGTKNPYKFSVPVGDLVVRLLQIAIEGYKAREFDFKIGLVAVSKVSSWEAS